MYVAEADRCDFAVLVGGNDFRMYEVHRNDLLLTGMLAGLDSFWQRVCDRTPPQFDLPRDAEFLDLLNPDRAGAIRLDFTEQCQADEYQALGRQIAALHDLREQCRAQVIHALGPFETGLLPDGRILTYRQHERKGYTVEPGTVRQLRVAMPKGGA